LKEDLAEVVMSENEDKKPRRPSEDPIIVFMRKAEVLARQLKVAPTDVYATLVEMGYSVERKREGYQPVEIVASVFGPFEALSIEEIVARATNLGTLKTVNPADYVSSIIYAHSDKGKERFTRVRPGVYQLQHSLMAIRSHLVDWIAEKGGWVPSIGIVRLLRTSYPKVNELLAPLVASGVLEFRVDAETGRNWRVVPQTD
jgi:hypothetical protein